MQPFPIVRSEAEFEAVATDSLVSSAYVLRDIYEKFGPGSGLNLAARKRHVEAQMTDRSVHPVGC